MIGENHFDKKSKSSTNHPWVALLGNPNCGKTAIFNILSGLGQKVSNYPGITVEKKIGTVKFGKKIIQYFRPTWNL